MLHCERIETALRDRVWTIPPKPALRRWVGLFLGGGAATLETPERLSELEPNMICLSPSNRTVSLRMRAGSEGMLFTFDERSAPLVVGRGRDADLLLQLLEAQVLARLEPGSMSLRQVEFALDLVLDANDGTTPGQLSIHDAALKIVLVAISHNIPNAGILPVKGDRSSELLHRFRRVLESRFRERWSVTQYAQALGIGADRLHDLCTSKLQKPPSTLIAERSVYEAKLLLRNTSATIEDIANRLGFKDPSHFSRYFSRAEGESARDYRKRARRADAQSTPAVIDYLNWP